MNNLQDVLISPYHRVWMVVVLSLVFEPLKVKLRPRGECWERNHIGLSIQYTFHLLMAGGKGKFIFRHNIVEIFIMAVVDSVLSFFGFTILSLKMWTLWKWSNKSNCFKSLSSSEIYVMNSTLSWYPSVSPVIARHIKFASWQILIKTYILHKLANFSQRDSCVNEALLHPHNTKSHPTVPSKQWLPQHWHQPLLSGCQMPCGGPGSQQSEILLCWG